ncbi:PIG-L deacetylase family protein [Haloactinopolyspora sp.]|jgi:LmbE family N-acetylglucosaminyl deacetylase|uniref:PIG-L deacetylase family protein n=1 Tax=Haloactinopolyspora sp. TaxID=1966353 RepID=UPI002606DD52|nr:PIG-L deacetylase family protein [Haloactinopolyspora sp.]
MWGDDFLAQQRVLVITPHADDETYGCAGSIARIKSLGGEVYVVLATASDLVHFGEDGTGAQTKLVSLEKRLSEFEAVMRLLKVDDWDVLFTDSQTHLALDTVPRKELVRLLESEGRLAIDKVRPTIVMIPAVSYNQDHEALFHACITATRPGVPEQRHLVPFVLSYDNTSLFWNFDHERFNPNLYIDVSEFLGTKIQAMRMHSSQVRPPLYHGSPESLQMATQLRGREVSVEAAEGFVVHRALF